MSETNSEEKSTQFAEKIAHDIRAHLVERYSNSLLISFALSFAVFNYKLFVVLFSDESFRSKFNYIDTTLYGNPEKLRDMFLWIPLLSAAAITFLGPAFAQIVEAARLRIRRFGDEMVLNAKREKAVPISEQIAFFKMWDKENDRLRLLLQETTRAHALSSRDQKKTIDELTSKVLALHLAQCSAELRLSEQILGASLQAHIELSHEQARVVRSTDIGKAISELFALMNQNSSFGKKVVSTEEWENIVNRACRGRSPEEIYGSLCALGIFVEYELTPSAIRLASPGDPAINNWWAICGPASSTLRTLW